jgi:hypothetical protein
MKISTSKRGKNLSQSFHLIEHPPIVVGFGHLQRRFRMKPVGNPRSENSIALGLG